MVNQKQAVFSCKGLGDGLISAVLAHNLSLKGHTVTLFHPSLSQMQAWFPHIALAPFPSKESLSTYDRLFFFYEKSPWMQELQMFAEKHFPERTHILNPIATPNRDYSYWSEGKFNGRLPFVDNLRTYAARLLDFPEAVKQNGIEPLDSFQPRRIAQRVILHPTSSRPGKNWPQEKFTELAIRLRAAGFDPRLILSAEERQAWGETPFAAPLFATLSELAGYVCESGWMIGNDSGIGHLASCLGLPTITICRSKLAGNFWRPAWSPSLLLTPSPLIPNLKGLRLRDLYWKHWIPVRRVLRAFHSMVKKFPSS
jgi:heptosyltransferase III